MSVSNQSTRKVANRSSGPSFIERVSATFGRAAAAYQRAFHSARGEARRPRFITSWADSLRWNGGDLGMMDAAQQRALQNAWLYTAVSMISREVSAAEILVTRTLPHSEPQEVPNHPLMQVLRRPNPVMGRAYLWNYTSSWLLLDGNAYWFMAPDQEGELAEVWPLPANQVEPFPGDGERFVDYYEFTPNGQVFEIPAEYICHFMLPNPHDVFRGLSPLVAGMLPVDADTAMSRWNGAFFGQQNVMPSAIINVAGTAEAPVDQVDIDRITDALKNDYAAIDRKTVVTSAPGGIKAEILGWSARDMDFLEGRRFERDEIFSIYGIPGGLLDKNATEANAQTADRIFKEKTIWPLLVLIAEQITTQVIGQFYRDDEEAEFQDIRPTNRTMELDESRAAAGLLTIDEVRKRYWKMPPLPDNKGVELYTGAAPAAAVDPLLPLELPKPPALPGTEAGLPTPVEEKPANNEPQKAIVDQVWKSAMVALFVPVPRAQMLAIPEHVLPPGSEPQPPVDMHITLAYLCEDVAMAPCRPEEVVAALSEICSCNTPVAAKLGGIGRFFTQEGGNKNAFIAMIDSPFIRSLHQVVRETCASIGMPASDAFDFNPHITLAYVPQEAPLPNIDLQGIGITFPFLTLCWGMERYAIPFTGTEMLEEQAAVLIPEQKECAEEDKACADEDRKTATARIERVAIEAELRRWQSKALRALKDGKAPAAFTTDIIPADIVEHIAVGLQAASSPEEIKALFNAVDLGTQIDRNDDAVAAMIALAEEIRAARLALEESGSEHDHTGEA